MQVITAAITEDAVLIHESTGKLLVLRDGLTVTDPVVACLSAVLDEV